MKTIKQFFTSINKKYTMAVLKTTREMVLYVVVLGIFLTGGRQSLLSVIAIILGVTFVYLIDIGIIKNQLKNEKEDS